MSQGKRMAMLFVGFSVFITLFFSSTLNVDAKKTLSSASGELNKVVAKTGIQKIDVPTFVANVIQSVLLLVGIIFFLLMVYAGLKWMSARGNEDEVKKSRNIIFGSVLGLLVIVGAYAFTNFITERLVEGRSTGSGISGGVGPIGDQPAGCCVDEIGTKIDLFGEKVDVGEPACRITTYADCEYYGNITFEGDDFAGPGTWSWHKGETSEQCESRCEF